MKFDFEKINFFKNLLKFQESSNFKIPELFISKNIGKMSNQYLHSQEIKNGHFSE